MRKVLLIIIATFLVLGSFAENKYNKVNTVYTNIPVRIMFRPDSTFSVVLNKEDEQIVRYEVINDTILKITHKGLWFDEETDRPVVKIKTPRTLNVKCPRYLNVNWVK
jgi:hypothetical protein